MSWMHPPLGFSNAVQKCLVCAHESAVRPGVGEYYDCLCSPLPARGAGECHSHPHLQTLVREQENAMAICATPVRAWGDAAAARALQLQLCGRVVHPSSQACASRWGEEHNGLCQCLLQVLPPYYTPCTPPQTDAFRFANNSPSQRVSAVCKPLIFCRVSEWEGLHVSPLRGESQFPIAFLDPWTLALLVF